MELKNQHFSRDLTLDRARANTKKRRIPASLSSEQPVQRSFGREILDHTPEAINLGERAANGLPLLLGHDGRELIGRVEGVHLGSDRKLRGEIRFGNSTRAKETFADVSDGILCDLSVGYRIDDYREDGDDFLVTRWTPLEVSAVSVPADSTVGFNRMSDKPEAPKKGAKPEPIALERQRTGELNELFRPYLDRGGDFIDLLTRASAEGMTRDTAARELLELIGQHNGEPSRTQFIQRDESMLDRRWSASPRGGDTLEEFTEAATDCLLLRHGVKVEKPHPATGDLQRMSISEMADTMLRQRGVNTSKFSRSAILQRAIGHSSSDFASLLANVAGKALMQGFDEAAASHRAWVSIGSASDFKTQSRVALSEAPSLEEVAEAGEYTYGSMTDAGETFALATYGKLFSITRQALINDDLSAFTRLPAAFGASGARLEADHVYTNILVGNPDMRDSNALFDATNHGNLSGAGADLDAAELGAAVSAMRRQKGHAGVSYLNLAPRYLIVPTALEFTARQLVDSANDTTAASLANNPFRGLLEVVVEPRLDDADAADWYLACSAEQCETVEITYLDGNRGVTYEEQPGWNVDGLEVKARLDFNAKALDWRGLYKATGT